MPALQVMVGNGCILNCNIFVQRSLSLVALHILLVVQTILGVKWLKSLIPITNQGSLTMSARPPPLLTHALAPFQITLVPYPPPYPPPVPNPFTREG